MRKQSACLGLAMGVLLAHSTRAEAAVPRVWSLGTEALPDFPVQIGGKVWVEAPYRIRLNTTLGYLPAGYVDAINGILVAAGAYNATTADLIAAALKSSFVFRLHAGWRPLPRRGG